MAKSREISPKILVHFARRRILAPIFEQAYKARTGENPVVLALSNHERLQNGRRRLIFAGIVLFFALTTFYSIIFYTKATFLLLCLLTLSSIMLLLMMGLFWSGVVLLADRPHSASLQAFCADLQSYSDWVHLGPQTLLSDDFIDDSQRIQYATNVIVAAALEVVKYQAEHGQKITDPKLASEELKRKQLFEEIYTTLKRIGLTTHDNYGPYYALAEEQYDKLPRAA